MVRLYKALCEHGITLVVEPDKDYEDIVNYYFKLGGESSLLYPVDLHLLERNLDKHENRLIANLENFVDSLK